MVWEYRAVVAAEEKKREAAVKAERALQVAIADKRVADIKATLSTSAFETVVVVGDAADKTTRTPIDKEELRLLCDKDRYCRDKGKK